MKITHQKITVSSEHFIAEEVIRWYNVGIVGCSSNVDVGRQEKVCCPTLDIIGACFSLPFLRQEVLVPPASKPDSDRVQHYSFESLTGLHTCTVERGESRISEPSRRRKICNELFIKEICHSSTSNKPVHPRPMTASANSLVYIGPMMTYLWISFITIPPLT